MCLVVKAKSFHRRGRKGRRGNAEKLFCRVGTIFVPTFESDYVPAYFINTSIRGNDNMHEGSNQNGLNIEIDGFRLSQYSGIRLTYVRGK